MVSINGGGLEEERCSQREGEASGERDIGDEDGDSWEEVVGARWKFMTLMSC